MNRRGFLGSILAACAAPAIVRADSLMRVIPCDTTLLSLDYALDALKYGSAGVLKIYDGAMGNTGKLLAEISMEHSINQGMIHGLSTATGLLSQHGDTMKTFTLEERPVWVKVDLGGS